LDDIGGVFLTEVSVVITVDEEVLHHEILDMRVGFLLKIAGNGVLNNLRHLVGFGGLHELENKLIFHFFQ